MQRVRLKNYYKKKSCCAQVKHFGHLRQAEHGLDARKPLLHRSEQRVTHELLVGDRVLALVERAATRSLACAAGRGITAARSLARTAERGLVERAAVHSLARHAHVTLTVTHSQALFAQGSPLVRSSAVIASASRTCDEPGVQRGDGHEPRRRLCASGLGLRASHRVRSSVIGFCRLNKGDKNT
jgi:hypothetical protein